MTSVPLSESNDRDTNRFAFGQNWSFFLDEIDDQSISAAQESLRELLQLDSLAGLHVEQGSATDPEFLNGLGQWDVVYSWGVLHHTGEMRRAIELVRGRVAMGGLLAFAIYNDQGFQTRFWHAIKRSYVSLPVLPLLLVVISLPTLWGPSLARALTRLQMRQWWTAYKVERGMSRWHDLVDWIGGYPFEVASVDAVVRYCKTKGFELENLIRTSRLGCKQFTFRKCGELSDPQFATTSDSE